MFGDVCQHVGQVVEFQIICVALRRVGPRMTHEPLQSDEVAAALADETVGEAVSKLVRGEFPHVRSFVDPCGEPPERLLAGSDLPGGIYFDEVLGFGPAEERVKD
jgi:hypothetical protein